MEKQKEFMIKNPFHALAIRSYLETRNLVREIKSDEKSDGTKVETYLLTNDNGNVLVSHNKYFNLTQVIISPQVSNTIKKDLQNICIN